MSDELTALREENARLRRDAARLRDERDRNEDLIKVMATRLAGQSRKIAELKQKIYDVTALD